MARMDPHEILRLEELCVQDEPPFCEAACPLHVDARAMLDAIARGALDEAADVFSRRVPLPAVLSRICDAPCESACKRAERGGALCIGALERTLAQEVGFAPQSAATGGAAAMRRPSDKKVAVIGSGLAGLTAAHVLAGKRHQVTVFEAAEMLGGSLRSYPEEVLPAEVIDQEIARLRDLGVEFRTGSRLDPETAAEELRDVHGAHGTYDTVCLCTGTMGLRGLAAYSPVLSMLEGRHVATSADRVLKGGPPLTDQDRDGPRPTRLYTDIERVEPLPPLPLPEGLRTYDRETAIAEARRCLQCECMECVKACEYLQHFEEYPGRCIRKVANNLISVPGKSMRTATPFINTCSLCGLCGVVCPTDLDMTVVNSQARRIMWQQELMPPAIHDFAIQDLLSSNSPAYSFSRHQPGTDSSAYLFFPGCRLAAIAPERVAQTYRLLMDSLAGGVGIMTGCCGAPAAWAGREKLQRATLDTVATRWQEMGRPRLVVACPACALTFREGLPGVPVLTLWEVLDDIDLPAAAAAPTGAAPIAATVTAPATTPADHLTLALHDPCTARTDHEAQEHARSLLKKLGHTVEELPFSRETTKCCGYGGLMSQVDPVVGGKVATARVDESPSPYVTYCINCRDSFARQGKECYHLLDLIFGEPDDGKGTSRVPTLSSYRRNRRRLAEDLLAGYWGETMPELEPYCALHVDIPAELEAKLDAESILLEDVQRTIHHAEQTGKKLHCPDSGHYVAHHREALVTFWVEYAPTGNGFRLFNAYSHRMQIVEERT